MLSASSHNEQSAVDMIILQRARLKFNSRKSHFESAPMVSKILASPRAKTNDVFKSDDDPRSPFAGETRRRGPVPDGVIRGDRRQKKAPAQTSMVYRVASMLLLLALVGGAVFAVRRGRSKSIEMPKSVCARAEWNFFSHATMMLEGVDNDEYMRSDMGIDLVDREHKCMLSP